MKILGGVRVLNSLVYNELSLSISKLNQRPFSNIKSWEIYHKGQLCQVCSNNFSFSVIACPQSCSYHWFHSPLKQPALVDLKCYLVQRLSYALSTGVRASASTRRLPLHFQPIRMKSNKKKQGPSQSNSESDSDEEDDVLAPDDFDAPAKFKVMKIHTASMRTDAIISNSLDVSRNRLEEIFYGPGLLLNGAKMLKKSVKMEEGDYVDLVVDKLGDQLKVKRVKIIKIYSGRTNTEKLNVKVRVWKAPFLVNNPDDSRRSS